MVAAEAAAGGSLPLVARHSGLAEVAEGLAAEYSAEHRALASFETGNVEDLAAKLERVLALPPAERRTLQDAARRAAVERWSWERVSARLLLPFSN
jgi:glycosyltransferase involved in cell wall biosynthesis